MKKNIIKVMQVTNNPMLWGGADSNMQKAPRLKKKVVNSKD